MVVKSWDLFLNKTPSTVVGGISHGSSTYLGGVGELPSGDNKPSSFLPGISLLPEIGLTLVVFLAPLVWTDSAVAEYTLPKLAAIIFGFSVAVSGLLILRIRRESSAPHSLMDWPLFLGLGAVGISGCFSQDRLASIEGQYNAYVWGLWPLALFVGLYFVASSIVSRAGMRRILRWCLVSGLLVAGYAIVQMMGGELFARVGALPTGRSISTFGSPVFLGAYLAALIPLGLYWAFGDQGGSLMGRIVVAVLSLGLLGTITRGAWVAAIVGGGIYFLASHRLMKYSQSVKMGRGWVFGVGLGVFSILGWHQLHRRPSFATESPRFELWRIAGRDFLEHPWVGAGPDTFDQEMRRLKSEAYFQMRGEENQVQAHNDLFQIFATMGLLGVLAYAVLLYSLVGLLRRAWVASSDRPWVGAVAGSLAALFICMKFNPISIVSPVVAAVFLGFLCREIPGLPFRKVRMWETIALAALAVASVGLVASRVRADWEIKAALVAQKGKRPVEALSHFKRGIQLNSCEPNYHREVVNHLLNWSYGEKDPAVRSILLRKAYEYSHLGVACHPNDSRSHYAEGVVAMMLVKNGDSSYLADAEEELDRAADLDSLDEPILSARLRLAEYRGDDRLAADLQDRLLYLEALRLKSRVGA